MLGWFWQGALGRLGGRRCHLSGHRGSEPGPPPSSSCKPVSAARAPGSVGDQRLAFQMRQWEEDSKTEETALVWVLLPFCQQSVCARPWDGRDKPWAETRVRGRGGVQGVLRGLKTRELHSPAAFCPCPPTQAPLLTKHCPLLP